MSARRGCDGESNIAALDARLLGWIAGSLEQHSELSLVQRLQDFGDHGVSVAEHDESAATELGEVGTD